MTDSKVKKVWWPVLAIVAALVIMGPYIALRSAARNLVGMCLLKPVLSSQWIADNLSSGDPGLLMNALIVLEGRRDDAGKEQAENLLAHEDNRVCYYATLYLASVGYEDAVPWLIRALRHPYSETNPMAREFLREATDRDFGSKQAPWIDWWQREHPDRSFQFSYASLDGDTARLSGGSYLITGVSDAVTIMHLESRIRLIGVRPRKGRDGLDPDAVTLLKTMVINQFVDLQCDEGPKLDENGARRAFVYWSAIAEGGVPDPRKGLPPVPFQAEKAAPPSGKPLINLHLLRSGLYEEDLESVQDPAMRAALAPNGKGTSRS